MNLWILSSCCCVHVRNGCQACSNRSLILVSWCHNELTGTSQLWDHRMISLWGQCDLASWPHSYLTMMSQIWCHMYEIMVSSSVWSHKRMILWPHSEITITSHLWAHRIISLWGQCELSCLTSQWSHHDVTNMMSWCEIIVSSLWFHTMRSQC